MVLSSAICTHALGVCNVPAACASTTAVTLRKSRRVVVMIFSSGLTHFRSGALDGGTNAVIGAAAANIAAHGVFDVCVARIFVCAQQGCGAHQLSRLAIAALRHIVRDPCFLQR